MTAVLVAACEEATTWPDIVLIAIFVVFSAFVFWRMTR